MTHKKCTHGIRVTRCLECGGSEICQHKKQKADCPDCGGKCICPHGRRRRLCKECAGAGICVHKKRRTLCKECGGSECCKGPGCEKSGNRKYDMYCLLCAMHFRPDIKVARNYKTKERTVVSFITENFPDITWILDKKVEDGCSKRRPDCIADFGEFLLIIEIDEREHSDRDTSCESMRLMELSKDLDHRPIVLIRFNPDGYTTEENTRIFSPWRPGKDGVLRIVKTRETEWNSRLESLKNCISEWCKKGTQKTLEIIHMFYSKKKYEVIL